MSRNRYPNLSPVRPRPTLADRVGLIVYKYETAILAALMAGCALAALGIVGYIEFKIIVRGVLQ